MANVRGTRGHLLGDGSSTSRKPMAVFEDIIPSFDWTEDLTGHYLLVDLPEFKKDHVKIQVTNSGDIMIYGERPVNENKYTRFNQTFKAPENSDIDAIKAKFEGELLLITVPKRVVEEKREPAPARENNQTRVDQKHGNEGEKKKDDEVNEGEKKKDDEVNGKDQSCQRKEKEGSHRNGPMNFSEDQIRRWEGDAGYLRSAMKILSKNKAIVVTAVLAFSLGMLISRKFESDGE